MSESEGHAALPGSTGRRDGIGAVDGLGQGWRLLTSPFITTMPLTMRGLPLTNVAVTSVVLSVPSASFKYMPTMRVRDGGTSGVLPRCIHKALQKRGRRRRLHEMRRATAA